MTTPDLALVLWGMVSTGAVGLVALVWTASTIEK